MQIQVKTDYCKYRISEMKLADGQTGGVVFFVCANTLSSWTLCLTPKKSVISLVVWIIGSVTMLCRGLFQGTLPLFSGKFWGNPKKKKKNLRVVDVLTEIRTRQIMNTRQSVSLRPAWSVEFLWPEPYILGILFGACVACLTSDFA
jgi:hypothetical protein